MYQYFFVYKLPSTGLCEVANWTYSAPVDVDHTKHAPTLFPLSFPFEIAIKNRNIMNASKSIMFLVSPQMVKFFFSLRPHALTLPTIRFALKIIQTHILIQYVYTLLNVNLMGERVRACVLKGRKTVFLCKWQVYSELGTERQEFITS